MKGALGGSQELVWNWNEPLKCFLNCGKKGRLLVARRGEVLRSFNQIEGERSRRGYRGR